MDIKHFMFMMFYSPKCALKWFNVGLSGKNEDWNISYQTGWVLSCVCAGNCQFDQEMGPCE